MMDLLFTYAVKTNQNQKIFSLGGLIVALSRSIASSFVCRISNFTLDYEWPEHPILSHR